MKIYLEINLDTENCVEFCVEFARDRVFFEKIHFFSLFQSQIWFYIDSWSSDFSGLYRTVGWKFTHKQI